MKHTDSSLVQLNRAKPAAARKARPKRRHWTDEFLKHLDAWGDELRKAARRKAGA